MFMKSHGPVSTRCALTLCVAGSGVRSETQLQILPSLSGCIVRRNLTVLPLRSRISALAYSVNRFVQFSTSLVMSQTRFMGALMMMKLSVRLLMISPLFLQATVGVVDGLADGVD